MRKIAVFFLLFLLLSDVLLAGENNNSIRKNEFELSIGTTYGTRTIREFRNLPFLSFGAEWRHIFLDGAFAAGIEGYLSAVPRKVLWEHEDYQSDFFSWRTLFASFTTEYRPFQNELRPFIGTAVGVAQLASSAPMSIAQVKRPLGVMIAPRIGVQPLKHFRLTGEFRWILGAPEFNHIGLRVSYIF